MVCRTVRSPRSQTASGGGQCLGPDQPGHLPCRTVSWGQRPRPPLGHFGWGLEPRLFDFRRSSCAVARSQLAADFGQGHCVGCGSRGIDPAQGDVPALQLIRGRDWGNGHGLEAGVGGERWRTPSHRRDSHCTDCPQPFLPRHPPCVPDRCTHQTQVCHLVQRTVAVH